MESASIAAGDRREDPARGRQGPEDRGARASLSNLVIGVASTAPAYSLAATLGFVVAVGGMGAPCARRYDRLVHPDAVDRGWLLLDESRRPGLRHQLHLGDPRDGTRGSAG